MQLAQATCHRENSEPRDLIQKTGHHMPVSSCSPDSVRSGQVAEQGASLKSSCGGSKRSDPILTPGPSSNANLSKFSPERRPFLG